MTRREMEVAVAVVELGKARLRSAHLEWVHQSQKGLVDDGAESEASLRLTDLERGLAALDVVAAEARLRFAEEEAKEGETCR